jgi:hypothetical protein
VILIYVTLIFPYELLFMLRRELKVNQEKLLNIISQYPPMFSCMLSLTIKGWDVFLINHPIQFVRNEITI